MLFSSRKTYITDRIYIYIYITKTFFSTVILHTYMYIDKTAKMHLNIYSKTVLKYYISQWQFKKYLLQICSCY